MSDVLQALLRQLSADTPAFADTLAFIEQHYLYQPQPFANGPLHNAAGDNPGSCKILGLALLEGLSTQQALLAFGEHYRHVLATPQGSDHANIRQLMVGGLEQVRFSQLPLQRRSATPGKDRSLPPE